MNSVPKPGASFITKKKKVRTEVFVGQGIGWTRGGGGGGLVPIMSDAGVAVPSHGLSLMQK